LHYFEQYKYSKTKFNPPGFATYYSYIGQNFTNPEFEPMKKLLVDSNQFAFRLDSRSRSSYPILLDADHPDELAHKFFGIPYYKGIFAYLYNVLSMVLWLMLFI